MDHEKFMRLALAEAARARAAGDVPIGAVVVRLEDQVVVGRGHNRRELDADPTAHAEILALREAARVKGDWRLSGHRLYVTMEPCPMCAGAAVLARLDEVVYGAADPSAGAAGSLYDILADPRLNHRVRVVGGVLREECASIIREFFVNRREKGARRDRTTW